MVNADGLILISWQGGKSLAWDVTVVSTLAQLYVDRAATGVRVVTELAAERKLMKYSNLPTSLIFQPIAVKNLGAFGSSSSDFISALGHKISSVSGEERETSFLFQGLSVASQRFSAVRVPGRSGLLAIAELFFLYLTLGNYTPNNNKKKNKMLACCYMWIASLTMDIYPVHVHLIIDINGHYILAMVLLFEIRDLQQLSAISAIAYNWHKLMVL